MKIHLYGDSYFEYNKCKHDTFLDKLKTKYGVDNIINHGKSRVGPHYNLPLITNHIIQNKIKEGDVLLCHISNTSRVQFPYKNDTINEFAWDHNLKKSFCYDENMKLKDFQIKAKCFYDEYRNEIDFAYLTFNDFLLYSGINLTGFLFSISQSLNLKVIVFDGEIEFFTEIFSKLNNKNFYYCPKSLFRISIEEVFWNQIDQVANSLKSDKRINHLSEENHIILFEFIVKLIQNEEIDNIVWKTDFRHATDVYDIINDNHPFKEKYIYD